MHVSESIADTVDAMNGEESSHTRSSRAIHSTNKTSPYENIDM